jgi:hypothetical protein
LNNIPRLSKAGMPSRSEGRGGLFKVEQYRLIRSASRGSVRFLRNFEQTTPGASRPPLLTKEGNNSRSLNTRRVSATASLQTIYYFFKLPDSVLVLRVRWKKERWSD